MKLKIKNASRLNQDQRLQVLMKAADAMNVIFVEKEPAFEDKAWLPHTIHPIADLEDWFYSEGNHKINSLKQEIIKRLGVPLKDKYVEGQTVVKETNPKINKTVKKQVLAKNIQLTFQHYRNLMVNPDVTKRTKTMIYEKAKQLFRILGPDDKYKVLPDMMDLKDLL